MSNLAAALTVLATLTVGMPAAYWHIRRAARADSERDRIVREAEAVARGEWVYTGPDSLRLLEDTEKYVDRIERRDRKLRAGFDRLGAVSPGQREEGQP
jgi:hypothetical protein